MQETILLQGLRTNNEFGILTDVIQLELENCGIGRRLLDFKTLSRTMNMGHSYCAV